VPQPHRLTPLLAYQVPTAQGNVPYLVPVLVASLGFTFTKSIWLAIDGASPPCGLWISATPKREGSRAGLQKCLVSTTFPVPDHTAQAGERYGANSENAAGGGDNDSTHRFGRDDGTDLVR
jgi:hypothetical protein